MSSSGISISDMQNFAVDLGGSGNSSSFDMSSSVGNIIELGGVEDLGDDLGVGLLSNNHSSIQRGSSSSSSASSSQNVSALEPIGDIGILEPLESISFDLGPSSSSSAFPDISVSKDSYSGFGSGGGSGGNDHGFSNSQTATGPSITLSAAPRMSQEEEKKRKTDLINKLNRLENKGYAITKRFSMPWSQPAARMRELILGERGTVRRMIQRPSGSEPGTRAGPSSTRAASARGCSATWPTGSSPTTPRCSPGRSPSAT